MYFERTRLDRLTLIDHLVSAGDRERHFALSEPVFVEAGGVISVDADDRGLVLEHADGTMTRHAGAMGNAMPPDGSPLSSDIAVRADG